MVLVKAICITNVRLRVTVATGFVLSPHSVLLLAQRADVIDVRKTYAICQ